MPGLIEWINKKTGDKLKNDKEANEFIDDFVKCCGMNIKNELKPNEIEGKILAHAKNQEDKLTFASILDKIKPNDLKKNAFADSRVVKKLGQRIQGANIDSAGELKRFFNSDTIKQITKNYYTKYKKYFKFDKIVEQLRKCNFNDEITLNKAGSSVRNLLYKSKKHKLEAWLAIFGPARRKDKTSKNIDKINEALEKKINRIVKHLKHGFWGDYKDMTLNELKKLFGNAKSLYDFIKGTLKIDVTILPLVLAKCNDLISLDAKKLFSGILKRFIYVASDGENEKLPENMYVNLKEYSKSPIQAAKRLRNKMKEVCSIDLTGIKGQLENEEDPNLALDVDELDEFLKKSKKIKIESPDFNNYLNKLEKNAEKAQKNPNDKTTVLDFSNQIVEFFDFTKENINKIATKEEAKTIEELNKELSDTFGQNKEINKKREEIKGDLIQFEENNNNEEKKEEKK